MERVLYAPRALPPLPPDVSQDPGPYAAWAPHHEEQRARRGRGTRRSNLRLVLPVADADPAAVLRTLQSVRRQRGGWSLTVVVAEDRLPEIRSLVHSATALRDRRRVRLVAADGAGSERDLLGVGIDASQGLPRALLFPGDVWAPDAVWQRPESAAMQGHAEIRAYMESQPRDRVLRHVNGASWAEVIDSDHAHGQYPGWLLQPPRPADSR